jgi:hypothetical protein
MDMDARCLYPHCKPGRKVGARGLCSAHGQSALKLVKLGKVTWEQLEAAGKARPKRPRGRVEAWFLEAASVPRKSNPPPVSVGSRAPLDSAGRLPKDPTPEEIKARAAAVRAARK